MSPKAHALLAAAGKNHEGGVPDWLVALNDIPALLKSGTTGLLGVVVMTVQPAPSFFRLSPESILRLRQQIGERLIRCVRPVDRLYSISQREGLVVLPELRSSATLVMAMLKLRQQFEEVGVSIDGVTMYLEVSCGAALYPDDGEEALHLVQSARIACLCAARRGLGYALYEPEMDADEKIPLIIWLHGGGEGGTDATIPLAANKSIAFASEEIQEQLKEIVIGKPETFTDQLKPILSNSDIFGSDLYEVGLGEKIEAYFVECKWDQSLHHKRF